MERKDKKVARTGIRFTESEAEKIRLASAQEKEAFSSFCRKAALLRAETILKR